MNDQQLVALFEGLDTPGVSDALDKLGLPGQCLGITPPSQLHPGGCGACIHRAIRFGQRSAGDGGRLY